MPYKDKTKEKNYMIVYRLSHKDYFSKKYKEWAKQNRDKIYQNSKKNNLKNKTKIKARAAVVAALKNGKLKRKPCQICGDKNTQAHHENYNKPLQIRWLCRDHHKLAHYYIKLHSKAILQATTSPLQPFKLKS